MAGKVSNILRNEQYMNDAASYVFSNYFNVMKRKRDHIWNVGECNVQEESLTVESELNALKGFWEVADTDLEKNPPKVIDEKKEMCVASVDIKTEMKQQSNENTLAVRSVSGNSNKMNIFEPEMSYQESDISVNKTSALNNNQRSNEVTTRKPVSLPEAVDKKKPILLPEAFHKTKSISMTDSFHGTNKIKIDQINYKTFELKAFDEKYASETTSKTDAVFQKVRTDENKLKNVGSKSMSKIHEYKTKSMNKSDDFQNWCLRRQIDYSSSPKKLQVTIPFLLDTPIDSKQNPKSIVVDTFNEHDQNKSSIVRKRQNSASEFPKQNKKLIDQKVINELHLKSSKEAERENSASESPKQNKKLVDQEIVGELYKKPSKERKQLESENESPIQNENLLDQEVLCKIKSSLDRKQQNLANESPEQILGGQHAIASDRLCQIKPTKKRKPIIVANEYCTVKEQNHAISQICSSRKTRSKKENSNASADFSQTMLSITIAKDEKFHEIMTKVCDLSRLKSNFPKFSEIFPDVDCGEKEFDFSFDAMKTVLGFMCNSSYDFRAIQNEMLAVEILALTHAWEITRFQNKFHKYFLQNILTELNASKIYFYATQFNLQEIKDACKDLVKDSYNLKYRQKKCSVAVTTYTEPLEFCVPLDPAKEQLLESFNRTVVNEIFIESISGCITIEGIQIQLNVDKSDKNTNYSKLEIYYSAENITEKIEICNQKAQKHLGPAIFLYFSKKLVIRPNQKGKIEVSTDIKPCLCFTFQKDTLVENCTEGKFILSLKSNRKIVNSDLKVFFIGKLLYHVKPSTSV